MKSPFKFKHLSKLRVVAIATLALFIAQLGAMTHAYSHVPQARSALSQPAVPSSHDACNDCLNFAPLLFAAGVPSAPLLILPHGAGSTSHAVPASLVEWHCFHAFRSRAPPALV